MRGFVLCACVAAAVFSVALATSAVAATTSLDQVLSASDWLNGKPNAQTVRGKVVLLDFYTFNCVNCQNVEPNLRKLYQGQSRADLVILGVHSPETDTERNRTNVLGSLKDQGIAWPVAIDNNFAIWNAYGVTAWPTQMIFDRSGRLRKTVVGDSQDAEVDATVTQLISQK